MSDALHNIQSCAYQGSPRLSYKSRLESIEQGVETPIGVDVSRIMHTENMSQAQLQRVTTPRPFAPVPSSTSSQQRISYLFVTSHGHMHSYMNIQSPNQFSNLPTKVEYTSPGLFHCRVRMPSVIVCRLIAMFIVNEENEQPVK